MHNLFHKKTSTGFSLIEMLIYISILSGIFIIIVSVLVSFSASYRQVSALRVLERSAITAMERMTRDIRAGTQVNDGLSTMGSSPGVLSITQTQNSVSTTTRFYISANSVKMDVNNAYYGPLTGSDVTVTSLIFRKLTSSSTDAVKIDMTLQATKGNVTKSKTYHSTIILKGS
ncbi:MAG: hypothetical protein V4519_00550 [Patescibacteria group bacterium]